MIRVFSIPKGQEIFQYNVGIFNKYIYYLNFSFCSTYIFAITENRMIYIFTIESKFTRERLRTISDEEMTQETINKFECKFIKFFFKIIPFFHKKYID